MGLDMYLSARKYVSSYDYNKDGETYEEQFKQNPVYNQIVELINAKNLVENADRSGMVVQVPVGYWRKANAIHGWFVKFAEEDDCTPIYISRATLKELHSICNQIMNHKSKEKAMELLPPTEGFFFGTYEIDEWYWDSIKDTIAIIDEALKDESLETFMYQASW